MLGTIVGCEIISH